MPHLFEPAYSNFSVIRSNFCFPRAQTTQLFEGAYDLEKKALTCFILEFMNQLFISTILPLRFRIHKR